MTTPAGAVAPSQPVQGVVLRPGANDLINPESTATHRFLSVIEELVRRSAYHSEQQKLDALDAVAAFRRHAIDTADHHRVVSEDDPAPVEDVRLRRGPDGTPPAPPAGAPAIDYNALAAALIAAQRAAQQAPEPQAPASGNADGVLPPQQ